MRDHPAACKNVLRKGDVPLSQVTSDQSDFSVLQATRFFFTTFSAADPNAWVSAFLSADRFFPGSDSAETMRRVLVFVEEMRRARRSLFRYSNPRCEGCAGIVTYDERLLISVVQYLRARQHSKAASSALLLCEGEQHERFLAAGHALAQMFASPDEAEAAESMTVR